MRLLKNSVEYYLIKKKGFTDERENLLTSMGRITSITKVH